VNDGPGVGVSQWVGTATWVFVAVACLAFSDQSFGENIQPAPAKQTTAASNVTPAAAPATNGETDVIRRTRSDAAPTTRAAATATHAAPQSAFDPQRVALALGAVLLLIIVLRWIGKRFFSTPGSHRSSRAIQVLSRSILSPKQQLMLVQVGRRLIVVADSGTQMNPLCEIRDADEVAELVGQVHQDKGDSITKTFGQLFGRAKTAFDGDEEKSESAKPTTSDDSIDEPVLSETRNELTGLADRIRLLSRQFRGS
jgi:flagellar biosynthetic protein FliO